MKRTTILRLLAILVLVSINSVTNRINCQVNDQLFFVEKITTHPRYHQDYIDAWSEISVYAEENGLENGWNAYISVEDEIYLYYPVTSMAAHEANTEKFFEVMKDFGYDKILKTGEYLRSIDKMFVRLLGEYSYVPEEPRPLSELNVGIWDYYYFDISDYPVIMGYFNELKDLIVANKASCRTSIYIAELACDMPWILGVVYGSDFKDALARNEQMWAELGEDGLIIIKKILALTKSRELDMAYRVPRMSCNPEEK